jgi:ABC-type uncharacterized transport system permease subunit
VNVQSTLTPTPGPEAEAADGVVRRLLLRVVWSVLPYAASVLLAFGVGALVILALGHDPGEAFEAVLTTSFSTQFGLVATMHKWVPIVLCAYAFTIPLATGKFNIGAEGQLLLGATGAAAVGITLSDYPAPVLLPLMILAGALSGTVWAGIATLLLVRFGVNEILSTVLLNFVSFQLIDYVAAHVWPDKGAGHPATEPVGEGGLLPGIGSPPQMHAGVLLAAVLCLAIAVWMRGTSTGFEMTAVGASDRAAKVHGVRTKRVVAVALLIGGGVAGVAGAIEVAGVHGKMLEGMQSNFLILGIIVGLMAKGSMLLTPFVAFGIAVLEVGAGSMQRAAEVPVETVLIIEALIVIFLLLSELVQARWRRAVT